MGENLYGEIRVEHSLVPALICLVQGAGYTGHAVVCRENKKFDRDVKTHEK